MQGANWPRRWKVMRRYLVQSARASLMFTCMCEHVYATEGDVTIAFVIEQICYSFRAEIQSIAATKSRTNA